MNPTQRLGTGRSSTFVDSGGGGVSALEVNLLSQGRLTLVSGDPAPIADQVAKSDVFFTPYSGDSIGLYTGATWEILQFSEISITLAGLTSGKNYDVFAYNNAGTLDLELSAAWTNDTTRSDALFLQDGVRVKDSDKTRRFLGTIRATGATTTEDSLLNRFVCNWYNRVNRPLYEQCGYVDDNALTEYVVGAGQTTWAKISAIVGSGQSTMAFLSNGEDAVSCCASYVAIATGASPTYTPTTAIPCVGIGVDGTTQATIGKSGIVGTVLSAPQLIEISKNGIQLSEGFHTIDPLVATYPYAGAAAFLIRVDTGRIAGDSQDVPSCFASALVKA